MNRRLLVIIAGALAACALLLLLSLPRPIAQPEASAPAAAPAQPAAQADTAPLFPGVDPMETLSMSILSGDRAFEFRRTGALASVNGHRADGEMLETLIEQITQMPIAPRDAFSPAGAPLMTITLASGGAEHTASFYRSHHGEDADVLYTHRNAHYYGVTDAWRVGTLLLACDGTRILDAGGNEAPAQ
ncbi:MAG: hypothetical protein J6M47_04940 [Clostridia bacterium]|nr:hypothetical protein [Clostridia bacterium]